MEIPISRYLILLLLPLFLISCNEENDGEPVVFVGDSLVEGWKTNKCFPTYQTEKKGISGARLEEALTWEIDAANKTVVFLIGTNNLGSVSFLPTNFYLDFTDCYLRLIDSLGGKKNIVISLLPRTLTGERPTINQEIKQLNAELKEAFAPYDNILFLDVYDHFTDEEGNANPHYFYDGLHLSDQGYNLLSSLLNVIL